MKNLKSNPNFRKKVLASALATLLPATNVLSDIYVWGSLTGSVTDPATCAASPNAASVVFTLINPTGAITTNTDAQGGIDVLGAQTPSCGTITFDTETQAGSADIVSFSFFGSGPADAQSITIDALQPPQDLGIGNLFLGNMLFNWNGNIGIPVSLAWDATGLLNEMDGTPTSFTLNADGSINSAVDYSQGALPVSDGSDAVGAGFIVFNTGPSPLAMRAENTANVNLNADECKTGADGDFTNNTGGGCMGITPSADKTALLVSDILENPLKTTPNTEGLGGNPMVDGPFGGNNANFDFSTIKLASFTDTTPPGIALNGVQGSIINQVEGETYVEDGASCTDAVPLSTNLNGVVVTGGTIPVPLTVAGSPFTVTYNCQDPSGNDAAQVTRTINVTGAGQPVITLVADGNGDLSPVTRECETGGTYSDSGASCLDPEDGPITGTDTPLAGNLFSLDKSNVDANIGNVGGPYTATWSCRDSNMSTTIQDRSVNVVDTSIPSITVNPSLEGGTLVVDLVSSTPQNLVTYNDQGASALDTCDTGVGVTTTGAVILVVPDTGTATLTYPITYESTDASGNKASVIRTVRVTRSQPVITLVGGGLVLDVGEAYAEQGMNITDAQQGDLPGITASGNSSNLVYTIDSSAVDTSTSGEYTVTYNVRDNDGNIGTQVARTVKVGIFADGSNFTMLNSGGSVIGGTNDVVFDWDQTVNNNDEVDYTNNLDFNMTIASQQPFPFFGFVWTAHTIRVFGPGTYSFDTGCTVTEIRTTGCPANSANASGTTISMTIPAGHVGAHILFDWNTTTDIDVVNVWDASGNGVWDRHGGTGDINKLYDGNAGSAPDPDTTWKLVSIDIDGDNINASPMVDGPFQGFNANFNAGPGASAPPPEPYTGTALDTKLGDGLSLNIWGLFAGLVTLVGLRRFRKK